MMLRPKDSARIVVALQSILLIGYSGASQQLEKIENRRHRILPAQVLEHLEFPEDVESAVVANPPRMTWIKRSWYEDLPANSRWSPEGAVRFESIVLAEHDVGDLRFTWHTLSDFSKGNREYTLTYWRDPGSRRSLVVEIDVGRTGSDLSSFAEETTRRQMRGELTVGEHATLAFTYGGREWTATVDDWLQGTLLPEDRELLDLAIDEDLLDALALVGKFARVSPELHAACVFMVSPLTGTDESQCEDAEGWRLIMDVRGIMACDFDARLGFPCPLDQGQRVSPPRQGDLVPGSTGGG